MTSTTAMTTGGVNKMVAMIAGAVLALVGILGFFNDPVLGMFEVNAVHNVVHLLSGGVLLAAAFIDGGRNSRMSLLVLGVVYALVAILGFVAPALTESILLGTTTNPALNMADNVLHVVLAVVFIGVPLLVKERAIRPITGRPQM